MDSTLLNLLLIRATIRADVVYVYNKHVYIDDVLKKKMPAFPGIFLWVLINCKGLVL